MTKLGFVSVVAIAASVAFAGHGIAQDEVEIKVEKLSDTISVLYGSGGNIGVSAGADGVYIIDDQMTEVSDKVKAAIATLSDKPVNYVINTHWHFDHAGGNANFSKSGSAIIAHDNVRKRMVKGGYVKAADKTFPPAAKDELPVITFNDRMSMHLNGEEARVIHVKSAHTDGDSIIFFTESNVVHMGDTFFNGAFPFLDLDSGGSINGIIAAAEMVLGKVDDKTQIIPGHGLVTDKAGLAAYIAMCTAMRDKIAAMKKSGMSIADVIAAEPTADFNVVWDKWGPGWKKIFVEALYDDAP